MKSQLILPLSTTIALLLTHSVQAATSTNAIAILNEGSMVFDNKNDPAGGSLFASKAGSLGSASASSMLGLVHIDVDSAASTTTSVYTNASGGWHEDYTITNLAGPQNGAGTAVFSFEVDGTFSGGFLGVGNKVDYTVAALGSVLKEGYFDKDGFYGVMPSDSPVFTISLPFTYGQPFELNASLGAVADAPRTLGFGHAHITLRQTGFTVIGGNYSATSATGAGSGTTIVANATYGGFTASNDTGHHSTATLLDGTASASHDVSFTFVPSDHALPSLSDTVDLHGSDTDQVVLQLQYDEAAVIAQYGSEAGLMLGWLNPATGTWENAVDGNSTSASAHIDGAYNPLTDFTLGNWGQDMASNTVWAVIDHNSEFTVAGPVAAPEPGSMLLLGLGVVLGTARRQRRQKA